MTSVCCFVVYFLQRRLLGRAVGKVDGLRREGRCGLGMCTSSPYHLTLTGASSPRGASSSSRAREPPRRSRSSGEYARRPTGEGDLREDE